MGSVFERPEAERNEMTTKQRFTFTIKDGGVIDITATDFEKARKGVPEELRRLIIHVYSKAVTDL